MSRLEKVHTAISEAEDVIDFCHGINAINCKEDINTVTVY